MKHAPGRLEFARARLSWDANGLVADTLAQQASGSIPSMAWADGLVLLDADVAVFPIDREVRVLRFADV